MKIQRLHLEITNDCDIRCLGCMVRSRNKFRQSAKTSNLLETIEQAKQYGVRVFSISGGEPMVHPDFMSILKACSGEGLSVILFSNLNYPDNDMLDVILSNTSVKTIVTSLDGLRGYRRSVGRGGRERTI